jgi:hypothetical protein
MTSTKGYLLLEGGRFDMWEHKMRNLKQYWTEFKQVFQTNLQLVNRQNSCLSWKWISYRQHRNFVRAGAGEYPR